MKLQLTLITTGIAACTLAGSACASPISSPDSAVIRKVPGLFRRGLSEWGIGHYGGTVSELPVELAKGLENNDNVEAVVQPDALIQASATSTTNTISSTITAMPMTETAASEPTATSTDESTSWSTTTLTETVYVTRPPSTVTAGPTETPAPPTKRAKREEIPLKLDVDVENGESQGVGDIDELDQLIEELNRFFLMDVIVVGEPCTPVAEFEKKICIRDKVAVCGAESWTWEVDLNCGVARLACAAVKAQDFVHGGWKADVQCLY